MVGFGWFRGSKPAGVEKTKSIEQEQIELHHGLEAVIWIMADDVDKADSALHKYDSSFHLLGRGVTQFMRAVMGFEQDVMKEAGERLLAAENTSWAEMKAAQKLPQSASRLYSPGQEYALCYSMSQLMSAVVAVLNESLTESIKGFYKLRKAYVTLDGILQEEAAFMKRHHLAQGSDASLPKPHPPRPAHRRQSMPGSFDENEFESEPPSRNESEANLQAIKEESKSGSPGDTDSEFVDAKESVATNSTATRSDVGTDTPSNHLGPTTTNEDFEAKMDKLILEEQEKRGHEEAALSRTSTITPAKSKAQSFARPDAIFFESPVDLFIHSGANLCYGLLLLILSMVPPAFTKLLYIIGFKGDRARGVKLLWQATKFDNINGAVAGLVLLGYYNGLMGFCDIILTDKDVGEDDLTAYPKHKCDELIAMMKERYPESRLWRLEEARKLASDRDMRGAIEILNGNQNSIMKQVLALNMFERSLCTMTIHDYALCSESFVKCTELNSWSHSLYIFAAGAAETELYRRYRISDPALAKKYKDKATGYFSRVQGLAGKKKFMAKALPFDVYVSRKVQKWEERAKAWKLDLVDCIGVSPIEEIIYLWNGYKRMPTSELEVSLHNLEWSHASHPEKFEADMDEIGMRSLLRGCVLRNLGKYEESRRILMDDLVNQDKNVFKGHLKDDWSCPSGYYEMAALAWQERDLPDVDRVAKVREAEEWLHKVARWETYVLDARIGMKVTTGLDTVKRWKP